jgi:hypothetical protein
LSAFRVELRSVALALAPVGDVRRLAVADYRRMGIEQLGAWSGEVHPLDRARLARSCGHARLPDTPAQAGYRYYDLGGEVPAFYLRRFRLGERTSAVRLMAPIEHSSGLDAERGAPAFVAVELSVGPRIIPWNEVGDPALLPGESALLARAALQAVLDLELYAAGECPLCPAPAQALAA